MSPRARGMGARGPGPGATASRRLLALLLLLLLLPLPLPARAWYKHTASPRYHTVGRAAGLLMGLRRSPYMWRRALRPAAGPLAWDTFRQNVPPQGPSARNALSPGPAPRDAPLLPPGVQTLAGATRKLPLRDPGQCAPQPARPGVRAATRVGRLFLDLGGADQSLRRVFSSAVVCAGNRLRQPPPRPSPRADLIAAPAARPRAWPPRSLFRPPGRPSGQ